MAPPAHNCLPPPETLRSCYGESQARRAHAEFKAGSSQRPSLECHTAARGRVLTIRADAPCSNSRCHNLQSRSVKDDKQVTDEMTVYTEKTREDREKCTLKAMTASMSEGIGEGETKVSRGNWAEDTGGNEVAEKDEEDGWKIQTQKMKTTVLYDEIPEQVDAGRAPFTSER
ncbi:hypothetical protein MRX96_039456 [Rhipicephalus microplus]